MTAIFQIIHGIMKRFHLRKDLEKLCVNNNKYEDNRLSNILNNEITKSGKSRSNADKSEISSKFSTFIANYF